MKRGKGAIALNIRQVAKQVGVSTATISRYLNHPELLSDKMKAHITGVIQRSGYMPDPIAQSLSTGQTKTIACVVPALRNEFFHDVVEGCQKVVHASGYRLVIHCKEDNYDAFNQRGLDGIIFSASAAMEEIEKELSEVSLPYVFIEQSDPMPGLTKQPVTVYIDDQEGMRLALNHLYGIGGRRFALICGEEEFLVTQRRLEAARAFFAAHPDCRVVYAAGLYSDVESGSHACRKILATAPRPDCILAFNDHLAVGVLHALYALGIRVPQEIDVMGFDDILLARYLTPPLSTVYAPNKLMGETAARLLLDIMQGKPVPQHTKLPVELMVRGTTKG